MCETCSDRSIFPVLVLGRGRKYSCLVPLFTRHGGPRVDECCAGFVESLGGGFLSYAWVSDSNNGLRTLANAKAGDSQYNSK